ncbi:hnh endonuclease [Halorubrum kocurii JCM 14978]|uniref:Hnh endonuclease n=1 Tax=Halorubrum kocurii JCM 14978 TaxID=1230456 RepID=M0PNB6_9EURY|nr:hnh endonuclease [Halorubrum kocurii JCM 14978]
MFGVTRRNTFHKEYRGAAYAFPLDEFNRGGRPAEQDDKIDETTDQRTTHEPAGDTDDEPEVPDGDLGRVETWGGTADEPGTPVSELLTDDEPT